MATQFEQAFHDMVLGDDDAPLEPYVMQGKAPLAEVMDIYRRNVLQSGALHLAATFPVCEMLVGERYFRQLCRTFIQAHPPTDGVFSAYGEALAGYVAAHEVAKHVPYLVDMGRLEWARHAAAWAKEVPVLTVKAFQAMPPEAHGELRLRLHPSFQIVASDYAIDDIWDMHQTEAQPVDVQMPQTVLIWRKQGRVMQQRAGVGLLAFYQALQQGVALEGALQAGHEADSAIDPSQYVIHLLSEATAMGMQHDD